MSFERAWPAHPAPRTIHRLRTANRVTMLQRTAGNRATVQLLQRDPTNVSRLAEIAKQLHADELAHIGIEEQDIHLALRVRVGEDDGVRPGLNIVANLGARGRTGFVDSRGRYRGDFPDATREGELPAVAIMVGALPFQEGDDSVLATLRHELVHAEHDRMLLGWLRKWRDTGRGAFDAWIRRQKISPVDLALVRSGTAGKLPDTELLAYIEGFAAVFERTPPPSPTAVLNPGLPPAIEALRGAAEHGWTGADDPVKTAARERLTGFYKGLDSTHRQLLRDWLSYLRDRATTPRPKDTADDDAAAARVVWSVFQPHVGFLDWMLGIVANKKGSAGRGRPLLHE